MRFKKVEITLLTGICMISAMMSACTTNGRTVNPARNMQISGTNSVTPAPYTGQRLSINPRTNNSRIIATPDTSLSATPGIINSDMQLPANNNKDNTQRAVEIKNRLAAMGELNKVNVFVIGNAALVGYSPSSPSSDIGAVKNMIINKVKETDRGITNVTVSESADVMSRINSLTNDMTNKRPMTEITNDFNNIIKSIAPVNR
jgi:YhcN/YlaJ family sporulation lipoprotein